MAGLSIFRDERKAFHTVLLDDGTVESVEENGFCFRVLCLVALLKQSQRAHIRFVARDFEANEKESTSLCRMLPMGYF